MTTSVALSPVAILQFFDNAGKPCIGGSLLTQSGGVNYPTYSEPTGTTALPNPIPLNSRGEVSTAAGASSPLFLQTGVNYTFTLKDSNGNQLWSIANITSQNGQAVSFPTASGSANAQIITNPVPISLGVGTIQWFLPLAANTTGVTLNVDGTGAKNVYYLHAPLTGAELQVGVPYQVIYDGTQWNIQWTGKGAASDYYADSGGVNALSITAGLAFGLSVGNGIRFKVKAANTTTNATPTFNLVLSTGAIQGPVNIYLSDGVTQPPAGSIIINNIYDFIYNSSLNSSAGGWICTNPSRSLGSYTGTLTGVTATVTQTINYAIGVDGKSVDAWTNAAFAGTSNTTAATITGGPTIIRPGSPRNGTPCKALDAATGCICTFEIDNASGTWTLGKNGVDSGWTSSSTKGFNTTTNFLYIHYNLDT